MSKVDIYLKGGAVVALDVEKFGLTLAVSGGISTVSWTNGKSKPLYISPDEIAVVIER